MKHFTIGSHTSAEQALNSHSGWVEGLPETDQRRLRNELNDLYNNGRMIFEQGGSFRSARTITLADTDITIDADFRQPTFLRKVLSALGLP